MSGQITALLNAGMDAFTNLWDINITFPDNVNLKFDTQEGNGYSVRANGFTPPELSATTTQVDYKGIQLTKLTPKIQGERTFQIEFRMDSNYQLYYDLLQWKHIWVDPSGEGNIQAGAMGDNLNSNISVTSDTAHYGHIWVKAYTAQTSIDGFSDNTTPATSSAVGAVWGFYDVICTKVGSPAFQRANSDFITVQSEFIFGRMVEPYTFSEVSTGEDPSSLTPPLGF